MSATSALRGLVLLGLLAPVACARPAAAPRTADELRNAIADYHHGAPGASEERINALFARLDADIAARRADAAAAPPERREAIAQQVATLEGERRELQQSWISVRVERLGRTAGDTLRGLGESLGRGLEDAGRRLRESAQEGATQTPPADQPAR